MRIGIAGFGTVGKAVGRLFASGAQPELRIFDKYLDEHCGLDRLRELNDCDVVFVCVPTPFDEGRHTCDLSAILDIVRSVSAPMCIKSTVPPGTVDWLTSHTKKRIAFSPEYIGESSGHVWPEATSCGFVIIGGDPEACRITRLAYESCARSSIRIVETSARAAELAKLMTNCYLATKVSFVNQFFDLASAIGVDYGELRELFLMDPRVESSHTVVTSERGFAGKCLPKDVSNTIAWAEQYGGAPLLEAVADYNRNVRGG